MQNCPKCGWTLAIVGWQMNIITGTEVQLKHCVNCDCVADHFTVGDASTIRPIDPKVLEAKRAEIAALMVAKV